MNIATFITHTAVDSWNFGERQADIVRHGISGAQVVVCGSAEKFERALATADVVLTWTFRQEWFFLAPQLKVISTPAAGKDYFHVEVPAGITMLNGHFHGEIIGETVVGMILGMARGLLPNATTFSSVPWARRELTPVLTTLRGARVTILGFGHIGQWIGRLVKPFGASVWGMTRHMDAPKPDWFSAEDGLFSPAELDDRLTRTDHLVLALPGTPETDGLMDRRRMQMLPCSATISNVGRGNSLDEKALIDMLKDGRLKGAALDVFQHEPLQYDDPVRHCPNLWTLPHASAIAPNYLDLYAQEVCEDLRKLHLG